MHPAGILSQAPLPAAMAPGGALRRGSRPGAAEAAPGGVEPFKFLVCVDDSPQSRTALRFAALRARNVGGLLALLHIIEPAECQEWMSIADAMEIERRCEAERLLHERAGEVNDLTGLIPELQVRTGTIGTEILAAIQEDGDIHALVVGAAPPGARRGKLISWLAAQLAGALDIPLVVVPGNLTDAQIDRLA